MIAQARTEFASVQGVGFCYGARMIVDALIASSLKAAVLFHPTFMTAEDASALRAVNTPVLFNCAASDHLFSDELKATFQSELATVAGAKFESYKETVHGFGVRPEGEVAQAESLRARGVTCDYFNQHRA